MVGTWLTAGSMCRILTQTGRDAKPAQRITSQIQNGQLKPQARPEIAINILVEEIELSASPSEPSFPSCPMTSFHKHLEKDPWGWFLHWRTSSTLLALFIREKLNWLQLILGVGSLKLKHFEASKSNQMLSIPIKGVLVILPTQAPNSWLVYTE